MGICASCLGLGGPDPESSETSRLLFDDPYHSHYGGLDQTGALSTNFQPDPQELKREREALEAICQKTSENVIDIFALLPQPGDTGDRAEKARYYQRILKEVQTSRPLSSNGQALSAKGVDGVEGDGDAGWRSVKREGVGKLYSSFGGLSQEIRSIIGAKG
ncbi:MAG: hypothetical protein M1830_001626 [Pleopsidium flavum]|nr:MAG: hypothetical protein M1830_001626 [Pleopsidium flavum]